MEKGIFNTNCLVTKSDTVTVDYLEFSKSLVIVTDGNYDIKTRRIIIDRDDAIDMAIKILNAATDSKKEFIAGTKFGRVVYEGVVVGSEDKKITGSLLQFRDGTCVIMHHENNAEDKGFTSPVIPESVKCISHCIDDFNKKTCYTKAHDIAVILDRNRTKRLIADPFTNEDRSRRYGLRPGDIVSNTQGIVYEVDNLDGMDNNRVYVKPVNSNDIKPFAHVAELLTIVTKVEDREQV